MARITYDSHGNDITCMKEFDGLKFPCNECSRKHCEEREHYNVTTMKLSDVKIKNAFAHFEELKAERAMISKVRKVLEYVW